MALAARKIKVTIKCNASHNVPSRASFHKLEEVIGPGVPFYMYLGYLLHN